MKKLKNKNFAFFSLFLKNYIHPHFDLGFLYKRKKNQAPKILKEQKKKKKKLGVGENPERKREGWVKLYYIHTFRGKKKKKIGKFGLRRVMVLYRVMIILMLIIWCWL